VYVIEITGGPFTGRSSPPGVSAADGDVLTLTVDARTFQVADAGITSDAPELTQIGSVVVDIAQYHLNVLWLVAVAWPAVFGLAYFCGVVTTIFCIGGAQANLARQAGVAWPSPGAVQISSSHSQHARP
jgi:hypothetical protein